MEMTCKCCGNPYWYPAEALDPEWLKLPIGEKTLYAYCACDLRICEGPGFNAQPCLYPNYPADQMAEYFKFINQKENTVFNINKCNVIVGEDSKAHQCKNNRKSGCTIKVYSQIINVCQQHFDKYDANTVPVYQFTGIEEVNDEFIICPDCKGESNRNINIKCGTCGCAGIAPKENTMKTTNLYLLECDQWMCEGCHEEYADSFGDYDIPVHMAVYCSFDPDKHDPDARCSECSRTYEALNTPVPKEDAMEQAMPRNITVEEVVVVKPYIDFVKLNLKANEIYAKDYSNAMSITGKLATSLYDNAKPGYVFNGSVYTGYVGHDAVTYVMVFNATFKKDNPVIIPMAEFKIHKEETMKTNKPVMCGHCHEYHTTTDEVARCYGVDEKVIASRHLNTKPFITKFDDGGTREWYATKKAAFARVEELKRDSISFTVKQAKNGNGWNLFIKS